MRISIIQNRIGIGGRNVVISEFIKTCNQNNISPVLFTFSSFRDSEIFKEEYGRNLRYRIERIKGINFERGTSYQTPLINILCASKLRYYDIVFNSGRCPYFLKKGPKYIHYIHFPVEASLQEEEHFQNYKGFLYTLPLKLLYYGRAKRKKNGLFLANSQFTAKVISHLYSSIDELRIQVVYPPCNISNESQSKQRDLDFVSLGSFISDKRQLDQLDIAKQFPQRSFSLIGGLKSKKYYHKCLYTIKKYNLTNVKMLVDAPKEKVHDILSRSKIYIHSKRNEHFGISTVEAIDHGCIPVVHDSGGSREIVPIRNLRFKNTKNAIRNIGYILKHYNELEKVVIPKLKAHIKQYSPEKFHKAINEIVFGTHFS